MRKRKREEKGDVRPHHFLSLFIPCCFYIKRMIPKKSWLNEESVHRVYIHALYEEKPDPGVRRERHEYTADRENCEDFLEITGASTQTICLSRIRSMWNRHGFKIGIPCSEYMEQLKIAHNRFHVSQIFDFLRMKVEEDKISITTSENHLGVVGIKADDLYRILQRFYEEKGIRIDISLYVEWYKGDLFLNDIKLKLNPGNFQPLEPLKHEDNSWLKGISELPTDVTVFFSFANGLQVGRNRVEGARGGGARGGGARGGGDRGGDRGGGDRGGGGYRGGGPRDGAQRRGQQGRGQGQRRQGQGRGQSRSRGRWRGQGWRQTILKKAKEMILSGGHDVQITNAKEKRFLYDIVVNDRNGIYADKFDYIARDSRARGLGCNFQFERLLETMQVIDDEICYRAKECVYADLTIHKLFLGRADVHRTVYTHSKVKAIELMISDALLHANESLKLHLYVDDPAQYWKLSDSIVKLVEYILAEELKDSRDLISRIRKRDLYKFCNGFSFLKDKLDHCQHVIVNDIICSQTSAHMTFKEEDICNVKIDLTSPLGSVYQTHLVSCSKRKEIQNRDERVSHLLPECCLDRTVRVYAKNSELVEAVSEASENYQLKVLGKKAQIHPTPEN